jgi:uncharacterized membrane protein
MELYLDSPHTPSWREQPEIYLSNSLFIAICSAFVYFHVIPTERLELSLHALVRLHVIVNRALL